MARKSEQWLCLVVNGQVTEPMARMSTERIFTKDPEGNRVDIGVKLRVRRGHSLPFGAWNQGQALALRVPFGVGQERDLPVGILENPPWWDLWVRTDGQAQVGQRLPVALPGAEYTGVRASFRQQGTKRIWQGWEALVDGRVVRGPFAVRRDAVEAVRHAVRAGHGA